jgi:hypothetical protein
VSRRPCFLVEHWLLTQLGAMARPVRSPLAGAAERADGLSGWVSTLLGPEGAAASWGWYLERPAVRDSLRGVPDAWFRPYLENYTVDASIFWNRPVLAGGA